MNRPDETRWGGVVGAAIEFGFASNWSVGVEYNYFFMGDRDVSLSGVGNFSIAPGAFSATDRIRQDADVGTCA